MNNLLFSCADSLLQPSISCAVDYGRANKVIVSKTPVLSVGNVPTGAEFSNAYRAGQIVILSGFTNFSRTKAGAVELKDEDTIGVSELFDGEYIVKGRLKRIDNMILRLTEILTRYRVLYMYYVTDTDWCFGGYKSDPEFSLVLQNVTPKYIDFKFTFYDIGADNKLQDSNDDIPGLYTFLLYEDDKRIYTEDDKVIIF